jgi:ABC-type transport system substrate-binding protein
VPPRAEGIHFLIKSYIRTSTFDIFESWQTAPDAQTITLAIRPDLQWNDGTAITSDDIVMTLTQYLDSSISLHSERLGGVVGMSGYNEGEVENISGLTAPDELTVVIELDRPDAAWIANLVAPVAMPILPNAQSPVTMHTTTDATSKPPRAGQKRLGESLDG